MVDSIPWTKKHSPKSAREFVGNPETVEHVKALISSFRPGQKPLLVAGSTGVGKTSLVYVAARALDMDVIEVNASDSRNKAAIESLVGAASTQASLFFRGRIILVDEVDSVSGVKDRGAVTTLMKLIEKSAHPIICTANDPQSEKLKALRKAATMITLDPPSPKEIVVRLAEIAKLENVRVSEEHLTTIAIRSGGDIRAAVNDLQLLSTGKVVTKEEIDMLSDREHEEAIEQALLRVFKTTSADVALPAFDAVNEQPDKILLWIQEALPKEYKKPADLARAYAALAEADRYFGRIRRWQYYRFYVYIYNLLSAGVAIAKDEKYAGMPTFSRPERPLKIWIYNQKNLKRKRLAEQLAPVLHTSTRRVTQDVLPYLKTFDKKEVAAIIDRYDLDDVSQGWFS